LSQFPKFLYKEIKEKQLNLFNFVLYTLLIYLLLYILLACDDSHLPVVQAGNLGHTCTIPRAKQSHRWSCRWGRGDTLGLVPLVVEVAGCDRTEDYQQSRVSKPPNVCSACVKIRASLACTPATAESWLRAYNRTPLGQVQSFYTSGSAKDLGSEYSRRHHCLSFVKARVGTC
jgi:hypothetical protein